MQTLQRSEWRINCYYSVSCASVIYSVIITYYEATRSRRSLTSSKFTPYPYILPYTVTLTARYDTIEEFNVDWKAECGQLNLAHVARNKKIYKKRENWNKTNASAHLSLYWFKIRGCSPEGTKRLRRKDLWERWVLILEWKVEGVIDGESEVGDCDEVICVGWVEPGGEWTQWGWWNEKGSWFHKYGDAYLKERLVTCDEENIGGPARVAADEERYNWTEIRLCM